MCVLNILEEDHEEVREIITSNDVRRKALATQGLLIHKLFAVVYNNLFTSVSFVPTQCFF